MIKYVLFRLLAAIPLLLMVTLISFSISVAMESQGSVAVQVLGEGATPENIQILEQELGLDEPLPQRFGEWLGNAVQGDFGNSLLQQDTPVSELISERIWPTLSIVSLSLLIGLVFGLGLGTLSGFRPGGRLDRTLAVLSSGLIAVPGFLIAMLLVSLISVQLEWLDPTGYVPFSESAIGWLKSIILPSVALSLPTISLIQRQLATSLRQALQSKYIVSARARGVPAPMLILRHALPNAMIPTVTVIGFRAASSIGLTFIVEEVFAIRGMGDLIVDSIVARNVTVVQGCLVVTAVFVVLVNLLVDISYGLLNPKLRVE